MGKTHLPGGEVWVFPHCRSIHTGWMRMAIDVAFLDRDNRVIEVQRNIPPWRILRGPVATCSVLEAGTGWLGLKAGDPVSTLRENEG